MEVSVKTIMELLSQVMDPELPTINIVELGIIRDVRIEANTVVVDLTPTYLGCPALEVIKNDIRRVLLNAQITQVIIQEVLSPAWSTDDMLESARDKLKAAGIAPPVSTPGSNIAPFSKPSATIPCPRCNSLHTECISEFGATACKGLYRCKSCLEPFEYFKSLR